MKKTIFIPFLIISFVFMGLSCRRAEASEKTKEALIKAGPIQGKEIKDPYLEQLFAPEFPYESIKVIDTKEGKRYVIVRTRENITDEIEQNYEDKTLLNRKITIYRSGNPHTGSLLVAEMRLHRRVSEMPFVVEYSKVENKKIDPYPGSIAEDIVRNDGRYLIIRIDKNFGKVFKRVGIYPEKETKCPKPPFVGKYPNSKAIACTAYKNKGISFVFVSKDKAEDIYNYYSEKLKAHYKQIDLNLPEKFWEFEDEFGIQIRTVEVDRWGETLDYLIKEKPLKSPLQKNGAVFHIVLHKGGAKSFIQGYTFIEIYYTTSSELIRKKIEEKNVWHLKEKE